MTHDELLTLLHSIEQAGEDLRDGKVGEVSDQLDSIEQSLIGAVGRDRS